MKYNILPILLAVLFFASCTPDPEASFEYELSAEEAPATVTFKNTSQNAKYYTWDFGDGSQRAAGEAPTHTYQQGGEYTVTLTASNEGDNFSEVTQVITVKTPAPKPRTKIEIVTNLGTMTAELYNETPKHRDNFIKLAKDKFYDGLLFHRIIKDFMIQAGDPESKDAAFEKPLGSGGPGYTIPAEIVPGMYHFKGALSAARQGDNVNPQRNSSGSQFYVVQGRAAGDQELAQVEARNGIRYDENSRNYYKSVGGASFLDGQYTVFGYVRAEDFGIIDKIAGVKTSTQPTNADRPLEDVVIKTINVIEPKTEEEAVQE